MHFAHFECVSSADNAFRFFRYEMAPGFFGASYLKAVVGRIGSDGTVRHLDSGNDPELFAILIDDARARARHGYELIGCDLPAPVEYRLRSALEDSVAGGKDARSAIRAKTLKSARAMLREQTRAHAEVRQVDTLLRDLEPAKKRASKHVRKGKRKVAACYDILSPDVPMANQRAQGQLMRDIVARIARELLRDDPLAADSVLTGLTLPFPDEIDGTNVTFLRMQGDRILTMSIEQFVQNAWIDGERDLALTTSAALREVGIATVADLIRWDWQQLQERAQLSDGDVLALVRSCARYKVYFNMEAVRFVGTS